MVLPFYVSPEQMMADKAEFAKKGIARGKSVVGLEYSEGMVITAENPSTSLSKISEIYDRIAFAGVGKYAEFENLRKIGIRYADVKGYSYSRKDVTAKSLANAYSQAIGNVFTAEIKPLEVEILVAEVADANGQPSSMYHILYDGSISDHREYLAIGGQAEQALTYLKDNYKAGLSLAGALNLAREALKRTSDNAEQSKENLEVALLDQNRAGRKFRRLSAEEVGDLLAKGGG